MAADFFTPKIWTLDVFKRSIVPYGRTLALIPIPCAGYFAFWMQPYIIYLSVSRMYTERQGTQVECLPHELRKSFRWFSFSSMAGYAQHVQANAAMSAPSQKTAFVSCDENDKPKHILSPVSTSESGKWRAYVEVDIRGDLGCLHTTRLWVAGSSAAYRLVYLIPPKRTAVANGMEIFGWAEHSSMFLVKTEEWQRGSDAPDIERVLAIDAGTGMVYETELEAI